MGEIGMENWTKWVKNWANVAIFRPDASNLFRPSSGLAYKVVLQIHRISRSLHGIDRCTFADILLVGISPLLTLLSSPVDVPAKSRHVQLPLNVPHKKTHLSLS